MSVRRSQRARILIADSHPLAARECKALLKREFEVVGIASDGRKLLDSANRLKPDIVIAETDLPKVNGFGPGEEMRGGRIGACGAMYFARRVVPVFGDYAGHARPSYPVSCRAQQEENFP